MMSWRFIGIDKYPGVITAGFGETWGRIMAKCILAVSDLGYKETFGTEKLCSEVDVGIEVGIHSMRLVWKHNLQE